MNSHNEAFKALPSVDKALQSKQLNSLVEEYGHEAVKRILRAQLDLLRSSIAEGDKTTLEAVAEDDFFTEFCKEIALTVEKSFSSTLVPVINLTGTVVHTNLGRARLPMEAVDAIQKVATQATNLGLIVREDSVLWVMGRSILEQFFLKWQRIILMDGLS